MTLSVVSVLMQYQSLVINVGNMHIASILLRPLKLQNELLQNAFKLQKRIY